MRLKVKEFRGDEVRIPQPRRGETIVVRRYRETKAMIMHPDDYARLIENEAALSHLESSLPPRFSDLAVQAHVDADKPQSPVTDPAILDQLFG